jgi:hypothetical protein
MPHKLLLSCGHNDITWQKCEEGRIWYCEACKANKRIDCIERVEIA